MARLTLKQAYPGIEFHWRSRNWWARLTRVPAECIHLERGADWMATFAPDTLYLRGKGTAKRTPARPEVSLCRDCLTSELKRELPEYTGRVIAFEPDPETVSQYFFIATPDFEAAGLEPTVLAAISRRLQQPLGECQECGVPATWLWMPREQVGSLDDVGSIAMAPGYVLCRRHGAAKLCDTLAGLADANLFYVNLPYGDSGAYVWI